jgi:hypothetical protein
METVKASFNLPAQELEQLKAIASERGITVTQALRQAIADEAYLEEQKKKKNKILIEGRDRDLRELVFRH